VIKMYPSKTTTMEYPPASQPEIFYSCAWTSSEKKIHENPLLVSRCLLQSTRTSLREIATHALVSPSWSLNSLNIIPFLQ
jgi:hypothetical protein